jgi:DNA-binding transcriptional ArsR family regulator
MADVFEALVAPARRAILDELCAADGQTLFELCQGLRLRGVSLTRQAVSQHLSVLEEAGLVSTERQGKYKFIHVNTAPLNAILARWQPQGEQS